ncbi:hypothetical protein ACHAW6_005715 [Cyclotella cf. meneghiniana]
MASSRWKRFAFFDRKNLPLPPPVIKDLIPSHLAAGSSSAAATTSPDKNPSTTHSVRPYPEESSEECARIGAGDYFSLDARRAAIPSRPVSRRDDDDDDDDDAAAAGGVPRNAAGEGVPAMLAGWMARTEEGRVADAGGNDGRASIGAGIEVQLLWVSSRNTPLIHCVDVTARCLPLASTGKGEKNAFFGMRDEDVDGGSRENVNSSNAEELDGWRGYYRPFEDGYVTKKDAERGGTRVGTTNARGVPPRPPSGGKKSREQRILDEHLGGGTAFDASSSALFASSPFFSEELSSANVVSKARVVGLASCSSNDDSYDRSDHHNNFGTDNSVLYVASITDAPQTTGIIIHTNPHLRLRTTLPPPPTASSSTAPTAASTSNEYSTYYRPTTEFNFKHGKPRCVTLLPGVACVGTDSGVVLVYVFDCREGLNASAGTGTAGKMTLVAEIPAPRGGAGGGGGGGSGSLPLYAVSHVKLVAPRDPSEEEESRQQQLCNANIYRLFVSYRRRTVVAQSAGTTSPEMASTTPTGGICCYDLGGLRIPGEKLSSLSSSSANNSPVVSARYDIDGRDVATSCLCDGVSVSPSLFPKVLHHDKDTTTAATAETTSATDSNDAEKRMPRYSVARADGIHSYSYTEKVGVCPVDGIKLAMCALPHAPVVYLKRKRPRPLVSSDDKGGRNLRLEAILGGSHDAAAHAPGASYVLVATTDAKSNRDAVDIYDTSNKLVGFHVLLSPGHRALRTVGMTTWPVVGRGGNLIRGGRASGVVLTSGGSIVTLTEKFTPDKVALLVQKQLYPAAISMAYSDPAFYRLEDITGLYRRYAEHLYRKGEFAAAMDQYILTIGSLESSHVIFRYLDAPKIPLVVKYLEALRAQGLSSSVHDDLLRTCYLKLNDHESASKIILTSSSSADAMLAPPLNPDGSEIPTVSISRNLLACADDPSEMLAAICSLEAPAAAEALVAHGPILARSLARETAGVVIALCDGTYSPTALADAAAGRTLGSKQVDADNNGRVCEKYPISLFANAFLENPKLFRLILSHCRRNDCVLTPMLRRTLLELTLDEWNASKRTGDVELEKLRHDEAITILSENQGDDIGDYEALVIVQAAGFSEGEILLYERLNMVPMLLEQYARSGSERARRNMLAMCEHDPELFAEVLAHFVAMAGEKMNKDDSKDEMSLDSDSEIGGLLHDIHEALVLARDHGNFITPVRVLRILAGEGSGQFSSIDNYSPDSYNHRSSVPLSVALDYIGATLDESSAKIEHLQSNVEEYIRLCNDMEMEIDALLSSGAPKKDDDDGHRTLYPHVDIDGMYSTLCELAEDSGFPSAAGTKHNIAGILDSKEDFWREMEHSDDPFETMCFFISKGYLDNI